MVLAARRAKGRIGAIRAMSEYFDVGNGGQGNHLGIKSRFSVMYVEDCVG